jgi:hypothetical protein
MARLPGRRCGFTAVELTATLVVVAAVVGALLLGAADQRRLGRLGEDLNKLRTIGAATGQYAADHGDRFWSFSWRTGQAPIDPQDPLGAGLFTAVTDVQAAANQAVYLMRTRGNRPQMPPISFWFPHSHYNHLPLAVYLDQQLPSPFFVSSADRERLKWSRDPDCFDRNCFAPCQPSGGDPLNRRWAFSGSFMPGVAFFDLSSAGSRVSQVGFPYYQYLNFPQTALGGANLAIVAYPSQKVMVHDHHARHFGHRQPYAMHDQARLPLLMADASAPIRNAADSNPGADPNGTATFQIYYNAQNCWEPAPLGLPSTDLFLARFRFTRRALLGRDFGGPETP